MAVSEASVDIPTRDVKYSHLSGSVSLDSTSCCFPCSGERVSLGTIQDFKSNVWTVRVTGMNTPEKAELVNATSKSIRWNRFFTRINKLMWSDTSNAADNHMQSVNSLVEHPDAAYTLSRAVKIHSDGKVTCCTAKERKIRTLSPSEMRFYDLSNAPLVKDQLTYCIKADRNPQGKQSSIGLITFIDGNPLIPDKLSTSSPEPVYTYSKPTGRPLDTNLTMSESICTKSKSVGVGDDSPPPSYTAPSTAQFPSEKTPLLKSKK